MQQHVPQFSAVENDHDNSDNHELYPDDDADDEIDDDRDDQHGVIDSDEALAPAAQAYSTNIYA